MIRRGTSGAESCGQMTFCSKSATADNCACTLSPTVHAQLCNARAREGNTPKRQKNTTVHAQFKLLCMHTVHAHCATRTRARALNTEKTLCNARAVPPLKGRDLGIQGYIPNGTATPIAWSRGRCHSKKKKDARAGEHVQKIAASDKERTRNG